MHKDELLQLHSLLCQVKRFFEESKLPLAESFEDYDDLEVSPQHIHKSKTDHKRAVFMLGKGLSELTMNCDPDHQARMKERFMRMAEGKEANAPHTPSVPATPEPRPELSHLPEFAIARLSH